MCSDINQTFRCWLFSDLIHSAQKSNIKFNFTTNDFRIPNGTIIQKPPVASKLLFTCR